MSALLFDNHTHSLHSFDGCERVEDICLSAVEKGLRGIALTDHCELGVYYLDNWREQLSLLCGEVAAAREAFGGKLRISFGVELGQPLHDEAKAKEVLSSFAFDVVLGSLHNIRDTQDFYYLSDTADKIDKKPLIDRYFAEELELAQKADFDIFAHLTYAYRYLGHRSDMPEPQHYEELLRELFKTLARRGKALEVNTSGCYRSPPSEIMPQLWELKLYKECGGELVTLGSDSHTAATLAGGFELGRELLLEAGFTSQAFFEKRTPELFPL